MKTIDVRGEICPYPMMITNKELDKKSETEFKILTDHSPALSTIPWEAMKRGFDAEIDEKGSGEWVIHLTKT
jgi:TusA-related sulfurtransferase